MGERQAGAVAPNVLDRTFEAAAPYEPRVIGGRLMMPAELQAIHRYVVETPILENITEEVRVVVETGYGLN